MYINTNYISLRPIYKNVSGTDKFQNYDGLLIEYIIAMDCMRLHHAMLDKCQSCINNYNCLHSYLSINPWIYSNKH